MIHLGFDAEIQRPLGGKKMADQAINLPPDLQGFLAVLVIRICL